MKTKDFLKAKLEELRGELDAVKNRVDSEAKEAVEEIEKKIENVLADMDLILDEEIAEFKKVGLFAWIKLNPGKAAGLLGLTAAAVNGALAVLGLHFGL